MTTQVYLQNFICIDPEDLDKYLGSLDEAIANHPSSSGAENLQELRDKIFKSQKMVKPLVFVEEDFPDGLPTAESVDSAIRLVFEVLEINTQGGVPDLPQLKDLKKYYDPKDPDAFPIVIKNQGLIGDYPLRDEIRDFLVCEARWSHPYEYLYDPDTLGTAEWPSDRDEEVEHVFYVLRSPTGRLWEFLLKDDTSKFPEGQVISVREISEEELQQLYPIENNEL